MSEAQPRRPAKPAGGSDPQAKSARAPGPADVAATPSPSPEPPTQVEGRPATWTGCVPATLPVAFGRYRLLKQLGKGGMGAVYLARDGTTNRQVAVKIPNLGAGESPELLARFLREAEERGMAGEIARSLYELVTLAAPTLCLLLGQGSGGGALALLPADRVVCAQHAWLSPLPPEGASAIVHRTTEHAPQMAAAQGVRSLDLLHAGIVDRIVAERPDAADEPEQFCARVGQVLTHDDPNGWTFMDDQTVRIHGAACDKILDDGERLQVRFPCVDGPATRDFAPPR